MFFCNWFEHTSMQEGVRKTYRKLLPPKLLGGRKKGRIREDDAIELSVLI
jgi:hypothetical protein